MEKTDLEDFILFKLMKEMDLEDFVLFKFLEYWCNANVMPHLIAERPYECVEHAGSSRWEITNSSFRSKMTELASDIELRLFTVDPNNELMERHAIELISSHMGESSHHEYWNYRLLTSFGDNYIVLWNTYSFVAHDHKTPLTILIVPSTRKIFAGLVGIIYSRITKAIDYKMENVDLFFDDDEEDDIIAAPRSVVASDVYFPHASTEDGFDHEAIRKEGERLEKQFAGMEREDEG